MSHSPAAFLLFLTAVSIDSLTAGLPYGARRVRIPFGSWLILACMPALLITAANRAGFWLLRPAPPSVLSAVSFSLLALLGVSKLAESLIRLLARRRPGLTRNRGYRFKQLHIIFTIYLSPEDANGGDPELLSPKEALLLSLALSLDSVMAGMALAAAPFSAAGLFLSAALFNLLFFCAGRRIGQLVSSVLHIDLSWLSGIFLIALAVTALV